MRITLATLLLPVVLAGHGGAATSSPSPTCSAAIETPNASPEALATSAPVEFTVATAVRRIRRLAAQRHDPTRAVAWRDVERALDDVEVALTSSTPGTSVPLGDLALDAALQDLAVGSSNDERIALAERFPALFDAVDDGAVERALMRAYARVLEPLVAPAGARRETLTGAARAATEAFERLESRLAHPVTGELPAFRRPARFRIDRLRNGAPIPRFLARDSAGNELRSAQLEGRITVLRFWDEDSRASVAAHRADAELSRQFWDAPFELVGVAASDDRPAYLDFVREQSFAGMQLFDGPISTQLADALAKDAGRFVTAGGANAPIGATQAWATPTPGSVFVVDARGVVRGRDLPHAELRTLVRSLIDEENLRRRESFLTHGRSR
ncbi:MAG: hypothetical protein AAGB93_12520 [Planctomycetota bacterium]